MQTDTLFQKQEAFSPKNFFKDLLFFGSVYYTAISVLILLVTSGMNETQAVRIIETAQFFKILLFSFLMALGSAILRVRKISRVTARIIHAACYIGGFLLFYVLAFASNAGGSGSRFASTAIVTAIFAALYVAAVIISSAIKRKKGGATSVAQKAPAEKKSAKDKKKPYTSQFS
jgi:peptidoglycan/LPS O-acetylase OafA/YrhL